MPFEEVGPILLLSMRNYHVDQRGHCAQVVTDASRPGILPRTPFSDYPDLLDVYLSNTSDIPPPSSAPSSVAHIVRSGAPYPHLRAKRRLPLRFV